MASVVSYWQILWEWNFIVYSSFLYIVVTELYSNNAIVEKRPMYALPRRKTKKMNRNVKELLQN